MLFKHMLFGIYPKIVFFTQHVATCVEKDMLSRLYEMEYTVQLASLFRFTTLQIIILDSIYFR